MWLNPELYSNDAEVWAGYDPAFADDAVPAFFDDPDDEPGAPGVDRFEREDGDPDLLPPAARRAQLRVFRVEALMGSLSLYRSAEGQIHAGRARDIRKVAVLLGAESENPLERLEAPSLTAAEISAELRIPARTARALVAEALALTEPDAAPLLTALEEGRLDPARARSILRAAAPVPAQMTAEFIARAVALADPEDPDRRPGAAALARSLRRLGEEYSAETLATRARQAREHRRVDIEPGDDGMCLLSAYLPLEAGAEIDTRLQAIARQLDAPGETRTVQQRRADALADLLLANSLDTPDGSVGRGSGRARSGVRTEIVVTIPASTLVPGLAAPGSGAPVPGAHAPAVPAPAVPVPAAPTPDAMAPDAMTRELAAAGLAFGEEPGEILGYGPIDAGTARRLAAEATSWLRLLTDPDTGSPLTLGRTRYTPPPALRRHLALRDVHCRFPGCERPSPQTEADHTLEWSRGGTTDPENLALLCSEHHRLKTLGFWTAERPDATGTVLWRSALGRTHTTYPGKTIPARTFPGRTIPGASPRTESPPGDPPRRTPPPF